MPTSDPHPTLLPRRASWRWTATLLLLAVCLSVASHRLFSRPAFIFGDFKVFITPAKAFLDGRDPYDTPSLPAIWNAWHPPAAFEGDPGQAFYSLVPPTTLAAIAPIALLPLNIAWPAWIVLTLALFAAAIVSAARAARLSADQPRTWLFVSVACIFGPLLSGGGNVTPFAASLMVISVCLAITDRPTYAGLALGLACAVKTQLALPLLIYFAYRRAGRLAVVAASVFLFYILVGVGWVQWHAPTWYPHWIDNLTSAHLPGNPTDFSPANPNRDHLVNIESALSPLLAHRTLTSLAGLAVAGVLAIVLAFKAPARLKPAAPLDANHPHPDLLPLAAACALCAIPVYHRYYDALPLLLAIAWAFSPSARAAGDWRWIVLCPLVVYLAPVGWQSNLLRHGLLPPSLGQTPAWQILVAPVNAWVLLLVTIAMLAAIARLNRQTQTTPAPSRSADSAPRSAAARSR